MEHTLKSPCHSNSNSILCVCVCVYVLESKMRWDEMHCWTWPNRTGLWSSFRADMKSLRHTNTRERESLACFCFYVQYTASTHEHWYHVCCCLFCCQIFWLIIINHLGHLGHVDWCFCWTRWWHCYVDSKASRTRRINAFNHYQIDDLQTDWRFKSVGIWLLLVTISRK